MRLLRRIAEHVAPGSLLLTETNVPSPENLSYFGQGDEAHMVYQFPLPPLLLETMLSEDPGCLNHWMRALPAPPPGCTYFNFLASHDGVGVRALEGILDEQGLERLLHAMHSFGGFVSMRAGPDGRDHPYEINISWFDAMSGTYAGADDWQISRFLCSQLILLGLQGVPAIYIHSLLATGNDMEGVERTGRLRSINRKQWERADLDPLLRAERTPQRVVFGELRRLIRVRAAEPCFDPIAEQRVLSADAGLFAFERRHPEGRRHLLALHNVTRSVQVFTGPDPILGHTGHWQDLISGRSLASGADKIRLDPYQSMWLLAV